MSALHCCLYSNTVSWTTVYIQFLMVSFELFAYQTLVELEMFGIQINLNYLVIAAYKSTLSCQQTTNDKVVRTSSGVLPTKCSRIWLVICLPSWLTIPLELFSRHLMIKLFAPHQGFNLPNAHEYGQWFVCHPG